MSKLVLLKQTFYPGEAHIIKTYMDANNLRCEIFDHHIGSYLPSNLTGGIRVMILEEDLQQALELLSEIDGISDA